MTIPNTLPSPSSNHDHDTNTFSSALSPVSPDSSASGEAVNWAGQLGLNQRMSDMRKTTTKGVWLNFGGRTHTDPDPPSFSARQISAMIAEDIMRESKRLRTQLLHVSSPSVTNGNEVVVDSTDDDTDHHDHDHDHHGDGDGAGGEKKKARAMVQAHLLLASAAPSPKIEVGAGGDYDGVLRGHQHVHASSPIVGERFINIQNINRSLPAVHNNNVAACAYNPVVIGDSSNYSHENLVQYPLQAQPISQTTFTTDDPSVGNSHLHNTNNINNPAGARAAADGVNINDISDDDDDDEDDGRIHSVPYKKNGPYTCPKCNRQFVTSQSFASHVSASHYKYETKAQRKKRIMAKIRKRNLRLQKVNGGLTFVPVSSKHAGNRNTGFAQPAGPAVKVEVEGVAQPGNEARANAFNGVKIKLEPDA